MSSSDSDEEPAIRYGTPLDPIEEDDVPSKRKYQQPADQYAVDAHGRRRFHGAFTGGFSAGYGNSVGTPEGWTPATFKSSRSEKAQRSSQRPEDFMDEEDRGEFGIAPRQMATHSDFSGQKRKRQQFHDGPIPGEPVLQELLKAVHETAAVKILRAMGWKPGQGTGDRLTKADKKRAKEQHKVYGCYMPPEMKESENTEAKSSEDSSDSEFEYETLFAPDDYEPYILNRKSDRFGLGYSGLSRHSVLGNLVGEYGSDAGSSRSHLVMKEKGKKVSIRGQAFGVGAFEADDDDIYASEDMSHYDFAIGAAKDDKKKPTKRGEANVLKGFVKASKPLPSVPSYPPPALPRDYTPAVANRTRFEPTAAKARDQGLGRHELSAEARGALLGEVPVPKLQDTAPASTDTAPPNEPTNIPPAKEDLIAKIVGRNVNFVSTNVEPPKEMDFIPIKDTGKSPAKTFRPFMSDASKQARYERYLADKDAFLSERDGATDALAEWERDRELVEFEQAAKLYKPLSGIMGDRFTHASEPDEALNPLCAVAKSSTNYGLATPEQIEAAARGVYGVMTRTKTKWRPEPLVCKRFNIPDPEGGARPESKSEDKPKVSYSIFSYLESSVHDKESFTKEQSKFSGSRSLLVLPKPIQTNTQIPSKDTQIVSNPTPSTSVENTGFTKRMTVAELFLKESEKDLQKEAAAVTETIDKFDKMDLYKSIFLSDSENEDETATSNTNIIPSDVSVEDYRDRPKNVERNLSPPRGIFANIDFDELNSWKRDTNSDVTDKIDTKKDPKDDNNKDKDKAGIDIADEVDVYGPRIPENLKNRLDGDVETRLDNNFKPKYRSRTEMDAQTIEVDSSSSSDSWVDAKEVKSKKVKKEKKKKKHKSKHKKSKHKKKDR